MSLSACIQVKNNYENNQQDETFFFCFATTQRGSWPPHSWGFLDHTQRLTTVGKTPLDEWSACRRDLYLTTHNTHNRQTSMPPVGFKPTISMGERPQTYALDRTATGTGSTIRTPSLYSPGGKWISMELQRNDNDRRKTQYMGWGEGLLQWHFVDHKTHVDWPGIEVGSP